MATNLQFIKEVTQSTAVTTFTVEDCFNAEYDVYQILINKMDSSTDNSFLKLNFLDTSDSVIVDSTYDMASIRAQSNTSFTEEKFTNQTGLIKVAQFDATASDSAGIKIMVYNPFNSSTYTFITAQSSTAVSSVMIGTKLIGVLKNTETVTGLRIAFSDSSGNLTSNAVQNCTVKIYGVK